MADRYWVGGTGTWDATTTNWAASSGGASGASAPTSVDNVFFDVNSNIGTGAFTVTITAATCQDFTASGLDGVMTVESVVTNAPLDVYGSLTLPATNLVWSPAGGLTLTFRGTTSNTLTTNGNTLNTTNLALDAVGGTLSLGSALALNSTRALTIVNGAFTTTASNYSISAGQLSSSNSNVRSISLNASAVSITGSTAVTFTTATNLTFSAGTSNITCSATSAAFSGGAQTFYNVTFSSTSTGTTTITGANTFNVLTQNAIASAGLRTIALANNQTIETLTMGSPASAVTRFFVRSDVIGTQRTLTVATLTAISDIDFRDIVAAGASAASPWTGTRLGDCKNNSNITFTAAATKYWSTASGASASWSGTAWATSSGGVPALNNFPLAQDTCIIDDAGATTGDGLRTGNTVTIDTLWNMGTLDFSGRTAAFNWTQGNSDPSLYGDVTLTTAMTMTTVSGTPTWNFRSQGTTQTLDSAGLVLRLSGLTVECPGGTVRLAANTAVDLSPIVAPNVTGTVNVVNGTFDLNNNTLTVVNVSASGSTARTFAFGTGKILLTGTTGTVWSTSTATNLTVTGTNPLIQLTTNATTGTRGVTMGPAGEANAISVDVTAGSDTIGIGTTNGSFKNVNFTGFTGTVTLSNSILVFGDWDFGGVTATSGTGAVTFAATSGIKTIRSNGVSFPANVAINGLGGSWVLQDALTVLSTNTTSLIAGTLDLNGYTLTTGIFAATGSVVRRLVSYSVPIVLTGNNTTVHSVGTTGNYTVDVTPTFNLTYSGSVGTRTISSGSNINLVVSPNINVLAGSDIITTSGSSTVGNLTFTSGFTGTLGNFGRNIYGNLTLVSGMSVASGSLVNTFNGVGAQTITTAGKTLDFPVTFNGVGGSWAMQDALTLGATQTLTMTNGTLKLKSGTTNTVGAFATSGTNQKFLASTVPGSQATISAASGDFIVSYLTIQDSNATGGALWNATAGTNVDAGNNTGWDFSDVEIVGGGNTIAFGFGFRI